MLFMAHEITLTVNYKKHHSTNPLQRFLLNNFYKNLLGLTYDLKIKSALDVGCAEGFALNLLKKNPYVKKLVGLDQSLASIKLGRKLHPGIIFSHGSIYQLPYRDNEFDIVICTEVLEHLENPKAALKEIVRVTNNYCLLSVPNEPWFMLANFLRGKNLSRWGNDIEHINHWTKSKFVSLIKEATLEPLVVNNPFPWTMVLVKKRE